MPCSVWLISSSSKSLSGETHLGCRSRFLGLTTMRGLPELAVLLPSQEVEVVGGRGADCRSASCAPGSASSPPGTCGVGTRVGSSSDICRYRSTRHELAREPWPVVAVRQQKRRAGLTQPLGFARAYELVDDDLRLRVREVPELRLPQHQRVGVLQRVPQLEPQHAELAQRRVTDREDVGRRLAGGTPLTERRRHARSSRCSGRAAERDGAAAATALHILRRSNARGCSAAALTASANAKASAIAQSKPSPVSIIFCATGRTRAAPRGAGGEPRRDRRDGLGRRWRRQRRRAAAAARRRTAIRPKYELFSVLMRAVGRRAGGTYVELIRDFQARCPGLEVQRR